MYRSRPYLPTFTDACGAAAQAAGFDDWERVLVNDGPPDDAVAYDLQRRDADSRIKVGDLSKSPDRLQSLPAIEGRRLLAAWQQ